MIKSSRKNVADPAGIEPASNWASEAGFEPGPAYAQKTGRNRDSKFKELGPVVQSVVSLTSSLRVISLTVLADSIYNFLIFFAEKMWVAFALQKLLTFF